MPRFDPIYTNFSAGEFSPLLTGRVDLEKYQSGCEILENFQPRPHGPAVRRGGFRFIAEAKFSDQTCRMIPFDTGASSGLFHLEVGDNYIRFYTEGGRLENPPGTPYEIATTYDEEELLELNYLQDANTLYIFHASHKPAKLVRNDTFDWVLSDIVWTSEPTEWGAGNYPGTGAFYEQRMLVGGVLSDPGTIWGSKIADFFNLTIGTLDDDAFAYVINTDKISLVQWFSSGEVLAVGTSGAEYKMMSTTFNETITPTNVKIVRQTNYGAANVLPIRIGSRVLFVQKGQLKVRNFAYSIESDAYSSKDLTLLSEHITYPRILQADYQNEPDSIGWYVREDGELAGVSYEPEFDITGWFRVVTNGQIESLSVTDGFLDNRYDDVYVSVKRFIDGADARYIEKLERPLSREEEVVEAFYVDSGLSYDEGVPTDTFTGLEHLEGETVQVLADGAVHPDVVVTGGEITLQYEATRVHAGLAFNSTLKTMRVEGGNPIGTSQGRIKRINRCYARLYRTVGILINDERYFMGPPIMNEPVPLFTGDVEVPVDDGYDEAGQIEIIQNQPLPMTIIAIMPEVRTQ